MPKPIHSSIRKDTDIRVRVSYSDHAKIREYAKRKKISVSDLVRQLLNKEIKGKNKPV